MSGLRAYSEQSLAEGRQDALVWLDKSEAHHLGKVLRARPGDAVTLFDGKGHAWVAEITYLAQREGQVRLMCPVEPTQSSVAVELAIACLKGKSMDAVIRRATELGASSIVPLFSEHAEVRLESSEASRKLEKWRADTIEACKQSGRLILPQMHTPQSYASRLDALPPADLGELRVIASLESSSQPLLATLQNAGTQCRLIRILIGPEGDFSQREYTLAREAGYQSVRLSKHVLRSEIAAAYTLSVVDAWAQ